MSEDREREGRETERRRGRDRENESEEVQIDFVLIVSILDCNFIRELRIIIRIYFTFNGFCKLLKVMVFVEYMLVVCGGCIVCGLSAFNEYIQLKSRRCLSNMSLFIENHSHIPCVPFPFTFSSCHSSSLWVNKLISAFHFIERFSSNH